MDQDTTLLLDTLRRAIGAYETIFGKRSCWTGYDRDVFNYARDVVRYFEGRERIVFIEGWGAFPL